MVLENSVLAALKNSDLPVFLARVKDTVAGSTLELHACSAESSRSLQSKATKAFANSGINSAIKIVRHKRAELERGRSLEALVDLFGTGTIVYDPTAIGKRSSELLSLAKALRNGMGKSISTIAFEPRRRTLYLVLAKAHDQSIPAVRKTLEMANRLSHAWHRAARPQFDLAVRVGFDLPPGARVVPVDSRSVVNGTIEALRRSAFRLAATLGLATSFGFAATAASAADAQPAPGREPAVSQPNITVITKSSWYEEEFSQDIHAKVTLPLGESFGGHIEGMLGTDGYMGVGGELFARDPSMGMAGIYSTYETLDDVDMTRIAAEAEIYLNQITLGGAVGQQSGDVKDGVFGQLEVKFYATPDFVLKARGETSPTIDLLKVGAEWRPGFEALPGLSMFADGEFGEDYTAASVGLALHFGGSGTTLIDRDRREDPERNLENRTGLKKTKDDQGTAGTGYQIDNAG